MSSLDSSSLGALTQVLEPRPHTVQQYLPWLRWVPSSASKLSEVEEELLSHLEDPGQGSYVRAGQVGGQDVHVWTRRWGRDAPSHAPSEAPAPTPLVMVHGMGAGLAMFALNIPQLSKDRTVLAIDLPGFGRSSRPSFSSKEEEIMAEYTGVLEAWRTELGLEKMILLGHSFGGFLSAQYSLVYPDRLEKLVLADPWGMLDRPEDIHDKIAERWNISLAPFRRGIGFRFIFAIATRINPLGVMRAAGPYGPRLSRRMRPDLAKKFVPLLGEDDSSLMSDYLYHCNAHKAEGEAAFSRLSRDLFWAKTPMMSQLKGRQSKVPCSLLLGEDSWIARDQLEEFSTWSRDLGLGIEIIPEAGHHIYADQPELFNQLVIGIISR